VGHLAMRSDPKTRHLGQTKKMYYDFAFTSNLRGWRTIKELTSIKPFTNTKVVDLGCAYGGFITSAIHAGARSAVGIEINPQLASIAKTNISETTNNDSAQVIIGDALDSSLINSLGQFDIAICNDVIEHVQNARLLVHHIMKLLKPGGIAYLEIPNKRASSFLLCDGHFSLFGITALPRPQAKRYYEEFFEGNNYYDTMGEYYEIQEYTEWFHLNEGTVEFLDTWHSDDALQKTSAEYDQFINRARSDRPENVSREIWEILQEHAEIFYRDYTTAFQSLSKSNHDIDDFLRRYNDTFWRFIVRRI
jgi:2-polyprenyl-3-methyl-5-hydroxy-6-metoxy-1,4-benzoquinol methylase